MYIKSIDIIVDENNLCIRHAEVSPDYIYAAGRDVSHTCHWYKVTTDTDTYYYRRNVYRFQKYNYTKYFTKLKLDKLISLAVLGKQDSLVQLFFIENVVSNTNVEVRIIA